MSKKNKDIDLFADEAAVQQPKKQKKQKKEKKGSGLLGRIIRRFFLLVFTVAILACSALLLVMNMILNGPSMAAREVLTMSLLEASATKWVPGLFIGQETVEEIRASVNAELPADVTDTSAIIIQSDILSGSSDEWANYPDGIRIEHYQGSTFNAHIMIIRDPSQVFMGTSTEKYSTSIPGKRINEVMNEADESIIAAINAGAFYDDGTSDPIVGSVPAGLVVSQGRIVSDWNSYSHLVPRDTGGGFAGFTEDNILVVAKSMKNEEAEQLKIRDGCEFGPVLIMNGEVNMVAYNKASGFNPRTAIGQRADGAVIFVCIDGRQAGSAGGTYRDVINIMQEYGAVNACNMDGGSSSVMMYRDMYGLLGEPGQIHMINSYSLLQSQPRRMPNFWLIRAPGEG